LEVSEPVVRAAGGLVSRPGPDGSTEVLLVHRPAYDDWSFPKGKAASGESDEACALREVEEETGLHCAIGAHVGESRYRDPRGRPKVVRYFAMHPISGRLEFLHEVDQGEWLSLEEAAARLSYEHDRALLQAFAENS
jgi:8-oxo-dGTP pyrophosphatase MutT (NUDIX family)